MAIAAVTGNAANSASAASIACGSFNTTTGRIQIIAVGLGSTASSVTSITDTGGGSPSIIRITSLNVTNIRVEIWKATGVATKTGNVFTANVTPSTTLAIAAEEYSGSTTVGINGTNSNAGSFNIDQTLATQDANNFVVAALVFAAQSGDTLTGTAGTSRQSSIPAATRPGVALYDQSAVMDETMRIMSRISTSREWATAAVELRSGGSAASAGAYGGAHVASLQADRDARFLHLLEPGFAQSPTYPPNPGANNCGFVG